MAVYCKNSLPDWLFVFIWFILSLSIFYSGHLYSNDTISKIESARNLIKHGTFEVSGHNGAWGIRVKIDKTYPHFSIGSILMMIPPVLGYETLSAIAGRPLPKFIQSVFVSGSNMLYTALSGCLIFILLIYLGKSKHDAFICANITIFCSEMLQYSSTGWSEPAALCWGLLGFVFLLKKSRWVPWALCAFAASLIRIDYIAFFALFLLIHFLYNKIQWRQYLFPLIIVCSVIILHMWYNYYRFESVFNFGYYTREISKSSSMPTSNASYVMVIIRRFFSIQYLQTIYRIYISFGRLHWFWVSPLLIFSPLMLFYKKTPLYIRMVFITACLDLIIIAAVGNNSWCWGNRYFYTVSPYLILPIFFLPFKIKNVSISFKAVSVTGFIISAFATLVNSHYVQELLVIKYGYNKAMWESTTHFFHAPFWIHVKLVPEMFMNTLSLAIKGTNLPSWEILRSSCLDIWPVGLCGAGVNSFISFGFWVVLLIIALTFVLKIIRPRFYNYKIDTST